MSPERFYWRADTRQGTVVGSERLGVDQRVSRLPYSASDTKLDVTSAGGITISIDGHVLLDDSMQHDATVDVLTIPPGTSNASRIDIQFTSDGTASDAMLKLEWESDLYTRSVIPVSAFATGL